MRPYFQDEKGVGRKWAIYIPSLLAGGNIQYIEGCTYVSFIQTSEYHPMCLFMYIFCNCEDKQTTLQKQNALQVVNQKNIMPNIICSNHGKFK
jgi:hypothetical protein